MVVGNRKNLTFAIGQPFSTLGVLALRAVTIATGIVVNCFVIALVATITVLATQSRSTGRHAAQSADLFTPKSPRACLFIVLAEPACDLTDSHVLIFEFRGAVQTGCQFTIGQKRCGPAVPDQLLALTKRTCPIIRRCFRFRLRGRRQRAYVVARL